MPAADVRRRMIVTGLIQLHFEAWGPLKESYYGGSTVRGGSDKTTLNDELWTSRWPLYSMKRALRNLFMKWLTRGRPARACEAGPLD